MNNEEQRRKLWCDAWIMTSELKPCPSCGSENIDGESALYGYIRCCDCGTQGPDQIDAEDGWNSLPRKIKLTKELPSEVGDYYWTRGNGYSVWITSVYMEGGELHCDIDFCDPDASSNLCDYDGVGYWAKVEQDMFEVCDE